MPWSFTDNRTIYSLGYAGLVTYFSQLPPAAFNGKPKYIPLIFGCSFLCAYAYCTANGTGIEKPKN